MKIDLVSTQKILAEKLKTFIASNKGISGLAQDRTTAKKFLTKIENNEFNNSEDLILYIKENVKCDLGLQLTIAKTLVEAEFGKDYLQKLQPKPSHPTFFQRMLQLLTQKDKLELILDHYEKLLKTVSNDNVIELQDKMNL